MIADHHALRGADLDVILAAGHLLRLDATPPPEWGQTFSLMAQMREPLLDLGPQPPGQAPWHNWSGEVYGDFPAVDVSRLKAYVDLSEWGVEVRAGNERARHVYAARGFVETGRRRAYYPAGLGRREDAIVMTLDLPAEADALD